MVVRDLITALRCLDQDTETGVDRVVVVGEFRGRKQVVFETGPAKVGQRVKLKAWDNGPLDADRLKRNGNSYLRL